MGGWTEQKEGERTEQKEEGECINEIVAFQL